MHSLCFIALLPEDTIQHEITGFKLYAAEHFQSAHALRSPPHVTLVPPFHWPDAQRDRLHLALRTFARTVRPFPIRLDGFDRFGRRVLFVHVDPDPPLLGLQAALEAWLDRELGIGRRDRRPFHPHVTVAFRDLRRRQFGPAWDHFSKITYERTFQADRLHLLRHNGQRWMVAGTYPMSPSEKWEEGGDEASRKARNSA